MEPTQTPIRGNEDQGNLSLPYQALVQFYYAFNHRDMTAMAANWAQTDEVAMDNPLGGIKRGWPDIRAVYEKIFSGPARVEVEFYGYTLHECGDIFYAVGRERGHLRIRSTELTLAIRTSRIFRNMNDRWRQVHHHGSIDDPKLLANYQAAILKRRC
jgi:limonene-1,2-epoxide hydrolase